MYQSVEEINIPQTYPRHLTYRGGVGGFEFTTKQCDCSLYTLFIKNSLKKVMYSV